MNIICEKESPSVSLLSLSLYPQPLLQSDRGREERGWGNPQSNPLSSTPSIPQTSLSSGFTDEIEKNFK